ncbi:MAG: hypothetical protein S0880_23550 [Actinomycetota bacterium]|nr:hypothetical protein [Actinomycetota bacterium]
MLAGVPGSPATAQEEAATVAPVPVFAPEVLRWTGRPTVEVIDDGRGSGEPGRLLELRPTVGRVQDHLVRSQRRVAALHDRRYVVQAYGYADIALRHEVVATSELGFTVRTSCTLPGSGSSAGFDRRVMDDADERLDAVGQASPTVVATFDHRGYLVDEDVVPTGADGVCRAFRDAARPLPLPDVAVAPSARWTVTVDATYLGLDVVARYDVVLDAVDGDRALASTSVAVVAAEGALTWPAEVLEARAVPALAPVPSAVGPAHGVVHLDLEAPMAGIRSDEVEVHFESAPVAGGPFHLVDLASIGVFAG